MSNTPVLPEISVIIAAHDPSRTSFLVEAVSSVLHQTLSRGSYEVVLACNFRHPLIDQLGAEYDLQVVYCPTLDIGPKHRAAIEASKGKVLCFLDYDDLFDKTKLEAVLLAFRNYPNLGYLHNGITLIDDQGSSIPRQRFHRRSWRKLMLRGQAYFQGFEKATHVSEIENFDAAFNLSSISVQRAIVVPYLRYLDCLRLASDTFLFYCSMLSPTDILLDSSALTYYRIHSTNVSVKREEKDEGSQRSPVEFLSAGLSDFEALRKMVESSGSQILNRVAHRNFLVHRVIWSISHPDLGPRLSSRDLVVAVSMAIRVDGWRALPFSTQALTYLIFPALGSWLLRLFHRYVNQY